MFNVLTIYVHTHTKAKDHRETLNSDGFIYYVDCGNDLISICSLNYVH